MSAKKKKSDRTKKLTVSLSPKEKSFLEAYKRKFNQKYGTKFSYGDIILLLCDEEATRQKLKPVLKQLSIFEMLEKE